MGNLFNQLLLVLYLLIMKLLLKCKLCKKLILKMKFAFQFWMSGVLCYRGKWLLWPV
jgi:hypothetical protein